MQEPLISVIIPIYNTEKYLKMSLDSITGQTYENLEIICVNDGSTDYSGEIVRQYAEQDKRIKVINQANSGVSRSRNIGIERTSGEWITFIDSDDYVSLDLYKRFVDIINKSDDFDIYVFNGVILKPNDNPNDEKLRKFFYLSNWKLNNENLYKFTDCKNPFYGNLAIWNKIYNRQFVNKNNIRFKENSIFEDQLFSIEAMIKSELFYLDNNIAYFYLQHGASTMHTLKKNGFDIFDIMQSVKNLLNKYNLYEYEKYVFLQHKFNVYTYLLFLIENVFQEKFFYMAKENLYAEIKTSYFNPDIIKKINKSFLFFDFLTLDYNGFKEKHAPGRI